MKRVLKKDSAAPIESYLGDQTHFKFEEEKKSWSRSRNRLGEWKNYAKMYKWNRYATNGPNMTNEERTKIKILESIVLGGASPTMFKFDSIGFDTDAAGSSKSPLESESASNVMSSTSLSVDGFAMAARPVFRLPESFKRAAPISGSEKSGFRLRFELELRHPSLRPSHDREDSAWYSRRISHGK